MNIEVVIYSQHLSHWRRSDYLCFWRECSPDLPKCVYVHTNLEEVSVRFFYESLQIAFPNSVLTKVNSLRELVMEQRGEQYPISI